MTTAVVAAEVGTGVVGQRQTRQHGGGGGDGTPDDELPFELPHGTLLRFARSVVRSGTSGLPGMPELTVN